MASGKRSGGAARQPGQGGDSGLDPFTVLLLVAFVYIMGAMIWMKFHTPMSTVYAYWRWCTNGVAWAFGQFVYNIPVLIKPFHDTVEYFKVVDLSTVEFETLRNTSKPVNIGILVFVIVPLAIRAILVSLKTNPLNHKNFGKAKDFNLDTFMKAQEGVYPHLRLYQALNMLKQGMNSGRLRMADNAKQFILRWDLNDQASKIDNIVVDREKAVHVFKNQLGAYWNGLEALTPVELVLFAAFAPKASANDIKMNDDDYAKALETSSKLILSYWNVFKPDAKGDVPSGKVFVQCLVSSPEYAQAKKVAEQYLESPPVTAVIQRHAYVRTVLYELLESARKTGVLPSAEFRWCKLVDRELWFVLNTVGRNVAVPEAAGVYAHYLYEMKSRRAVEKPSVELAVDALQGAFVKLNFSDDEWIGHQSRLAALEAQAKATETAGERDAGLETVH